MIHGFYLTLIMVAACSGSHAEDRLVILLPSEPGVRAVMTVTPLPFGYSASGELGRGASLEITALKSPGAGGLSVQKTEYGYDASVVRGAGVYNLSLQCKAKDSRCASDAYIRRLAASLKP